MASNWSAYHVQPSKDSFPSKQETASKIANIFNEPYRYADPGVNPSSSRVHTYMRQVRAVVEELRTKSNRINEEIKSLLKLKEGLALSLDQLNAEIRAPTPDAMISRPRFIKNRREEAKADLTTRGLSTVRFSKTDSKIILRRLQEQYSAVKNQLKILGETRNTVAKAITEKVRVLDVLPYVTAATVKTRQLQAEEAAIAWQNEKDAALALAFENNERIVRGSSNRPKVGRKYFHETKKSIDERTGLTPKSKHIDLSPHSRECPSPSKTISSNRNTTDTHSLPDALSEDCKAALALAQQTRGVSRRTRNVVKDVVFDCFNRRTNSPVHNQTTKQPEQT